MAAFAAPPAAASAHASDQSFVLLLPTDYYIAGGVAAVVLTVVLISLVPPRAAWAIFATVPIGWSRRLPGRTLASTVSACTLAALVAGGLGGTNDPTHNILPVFVWTVFWIALVVLQGLFGNLWAWLNPWTGPASLLRATGLQPVLRLNPALGYWPALAFLLAFAAFLLVDVAPSDPDRLAAAVGIWWAGHFAATLVFGPRWLRRAEALTVLMNAYALMASPGICRGRWRIGMPGWKALCGPAPPVSLAVFMLALLAVGSFDGLYETFFWFGLTGQNPLEFTGRSAVAGQSLAGLAGAVPLLALVYAACLWLGLRAAGGGTTPGLAFRTFAPALLPIALAYHIAHYLPSFLVEAQAVPIVLNDPMGTGANLLGLGHLNVTTGFFNRLDTVRVIWLTQAAAVVAGHIVAILLSHVLALRLFGTHRRAALAQAPLAAFMVVYTLFGLWLLASPRGV